MVNATGGAGLAAANTDALTGLGFHTGAPANAGTQPTTTISYPTGMQAEAQAVAAQVAPSPVSAAQTPAPGGTGDAGAPTTPAQAFTAASCIN